MSLIYWLISTKFHRYAKYCISRSFIKKKKKQTERGEPTTQLEEVSHQNSVLIIQNEITQGVDTETQIIKNSASISCMVHETNPTR